MGVRSTVEMTNLYLTNLHCKPRKVRAKAKEGSLGILAFTKHCLPSHDHNDGSWQGPRVLVRILNFQVVSRLHSTKKKTLPTSHQAYYVSHHDHGRGRGPNLVFKGAAPYPLVQDHRGHHHSWQGLWLVEPHMVVRQSTASWGLNGFFYFRYVKAMLFYPSLGPLYKSF